MPATGGYFHPAVASKNNPTTIARTQIGLTVLGHNLRILAKLQEKKKRDATDASAHKIAA